jgi:hypothetical protein
MRAACSAICAADGISVYAVHHLQPNRTFYFTQGILLSL